MPKFTNEERTLVKSIVATLSIKRVPDPEIIKEIYQQTNKSITRMGLYYVRQIKYSVDRKETRVLSSLPDRKLVIMQSKIK